MSRRTLRQVLLATANFVAPRAASRLILAQALTRFCRSHLARPTLVVAVKARRAGRDKFHVVRIVRSGNRIEVSCLEWALINRYGTLRSRLPGVLTPIATAPTRHLEAVAEVSDGEDGGPGLVGFCSHDPQAVLVPDDGFVQSRGYEQCRELAKANLTGWSERTDWIIWRGSTTGTGLASKPHMSSQDPELLPRVRLCLELHGVPGTDVKISGVVQQNELIAHKNRLANSGILGNYISPIAWHGCKFAIDIDGNSNAWSNFFTRLLMGCCVLKIASPGGYRQWYYHELEPWTHFVPVAADLSDLRERIAWSRANLEQCRRIAANGQAFAMAHTFETEIERGGLRVYEAYKSGLLRTKL